MQFSCCVSPEEAQDSYQISSCPFSPSFQSVCENSTTTRSDRFSTGATVGTSC